MVETSGFLHRLEGPTSFTNNRANRAGAIFNVVELNSFSVENFEETYGREYRPAIISFPDDTVFQDNDANVSLSVVRWGFQACLLQFRSRLLPVFVCFSPSQGRRCTGPRALKVYTSVW